MNILNLGIDSAKHDTQELFEATQAERSTLLGRVRTLQLAAQLLVQAEGQRLARLKPADGRIAALARSERVLRERVSLLDTELEVAAIRVPPVSKTDTLLHGRVTDDAQRAAGAVTVQLVRADGSAVRGVAPVAVDAAGYYAFVIDPQVAATLGAEEHLGVVVQRGDHSVAPKGASGFTLASGMVMVKDIALSDRELRALELRRNLAATPTVAPAPGGAPTRVRKPK